MNDMRTFARANLDPSGRRLQRVLQQTHESRKPAGRADMSIGMGWHILRLNGHDVVWHNGGTGGYRTWMGFDKARKVAAIVLTNAGGAGNDDLGFELARGLRSSRGRPSSRPAHRTSRIAHRASLRRVRA